MMRTIFIAVLALILPGCSTTTSSVGDEENAAIREAGDQYIQSSMKRSNKTETFTAPDESGTLRMTARTTIVDIARQTYDDLEAAILVVRVEGSISGDGVDPDEWAVFTNDLTGQEFSLLYGEGTLVQIDEDEQHVELTGHKSLYAVLQNDEWKIYERVPYFPDAETENDFMLKRDSLMSYYKQAIR